MFFNDKLGDNGTRHLHADTGHDSHCHYSSPGVARIYPNLSTVSKGPKGEADREPGFPLRFPLHLHPHFLVSFASFPQKLRSSSSLSSPPFQLQSLSSLLHEGFAHKPYPCQSETTKVHKCKTLENQFSWNLQPSLCQTSKVVSFSLLHFLYS